jgi:hypothetical protein
MKSYTRVIAQIECMVALIIGIIIVVPGNAIATPVKKAWDDTTIIQVKNNLRQIAEAATLWEKSGGCSMRDCALIDNLVAAGKLATAPQVPPAIGIDGTPLFYSTTERPMGGCGPNNVGTPVTTNLTLLNVSEQFCKDYNSSVGLGSVIVKNCNSGGNCTASGSTNPYHFPIVNSSSFCFLRLDIYAVVWLTTISSTPCPQGGF